MADFIGFILMIAVLLFFPYRRVYNRLNLYVEAKLLLTGIALIVLRIIWAVMLPDSGETLVTSTVDKFSFTDSFSFMTGAFADALGWMLTIAGVIIILFTLWDAENHQREMLEEDDCQLEINDRNK